MKASSACSGRGVQDLPASARSDVRAYCGAVESEWIAASGRGEVWSFTIIHAPTLPAFADQVPYGAVVVRLDEGVFLVSNVVDCPNDTLAVGTASSWRSPSSPTTSHSRCSAGPMS